MPKLTSLIILTAASVFSSQMVMASSHYSPAKVCFNSTSNGSDGVDKLREKMTQLKPKENNEMSGCLPAKVYLNVGSNGSDGVDYFQEKMRTLRGDNSLDVQNLETPAEVYLNVGSNGTDGVDQLQEKMKKLHASNHLVNQEPGSPVAQYFYDNNQRHTF